VNGSGGVPVVGHMRGFTKLMLRRKWAWGTYWLGKRLCPSKDEGRNSALYVYKRLPDFTVSCRIQCKPLPILSNIISIHNDYFHCH